MQPMKYTDLADLPTADGRLRCGERDCPEGEWSERANGRPKVVSVAAS